MGKKCFIASCFGVYLLLSTVSPALAAPATSSAGTDANTTGSMLGLVEGIRYFCEKVSPGSAASYKQVDQLLVSSQTARVLSQIRNSNAYLNAEARIHKQLQALPRKEASSVCNAH